MLADPGFVEADSVEVRDELEIALQGQRRIRAGPVERGDEISKPELGHGVPLRSSCPNHNARRPWLGQKGGPQIVLSRRGQIHMAPPAWEQVLVAGVF